MSHAHSIRALLPVLAVAGASFAAFPAAAQTIEELKKQDSRYIDWLQEYKAAKTLQHYAAGVTGVTDEAKLTLKIAVATTQIDSLRAQAGTASAKRQSELYVELRKRFEDLLAAKRERAEKFTGGDSALYWQTELLSDMVDTYLRVYRNNAAAAYEFGSPDADQKQAFAEVVPQVYLAAVRAAKTADNTQRRMMADRLYIRNLTRSGLRNKIEESQRMAKYWLGVSSYWMTLLPDAHPYYAGLGKPGVFAVPGQKPVPADERKRLLALAADALSANGSADAKAMLACVLLAQGKNQEAAKAAQTINMGDYTTRDSAWVVVRILAAKAKVTAGNGKLDDAVRELRAEAVSNPALLADLQEGAGFAYLFLCDAAHRLLMDAANAKKPVDVELFNKSFMDPYADIFAEDAGKGGVDEAAKQAIRALRPVLQQRWSAEFANVPANQKPGFLILQTLDVEYGQVFAAGGLWSQVKDAGKAPDPAQLKELTEKLRHIEDGIQVALDKEQVKVIRAKLLNQRALTRYLGAQAGVYLVVDPKNTTVAEADQSVRAAAMDWLELATTAPASADAPQAIDYATGMLHLMHENNMYQADYAAACKVLFTQYPQTKAADRELPYYADKVLAAAGKTDEALALLRKMPKEDPYYFTAQQKAVTLLERLRKAAQSAADAKKGTPEAGAADTKFAAATATFLKAATTLEDEAKKASKEGVSGYRRASARFVQASTLILHANALAANGAASEGVALLDGFEDKFNPETALVAQDFEKQEDLAKMREYLSAQVEYAQVSRLRMLMDAGQGSQVKSRALELLSNGNPKSALVLKGLLRDIKTETDRLTSVIGRTTYAPLKTELLVKRQKYGAAMLDLTNILRDKLMASADRQTKEYLDLLLVQAKSASGDTVGAVAEVDRLLAEEAAVVAKDKTHPRSLNLLLVASQTYYDHGVSFVDPASPERKSALVKAYKTAKTIVDNFLARGPGTTGFETAFYEALWTQLSALENMQPIGNVKGIRNNIPGTIDTILQRDPKGFGELPWGDRFTELKDRMLFEAQNAK